MESTSASLLERLSDRDDNRSWDLLVRLYSPLIGNWLRRQGLPTEDVEDLTQDVLGVVARRMPEFRHNGRVGAFRAWLRAIATHCLRRTWRQQRGQPAWEGLGAALDQLEDPNSDASHFWDREHDRHVLGRLLEALEPEFRPGTWTAFRRQALEGASAAEVAGELGSTVNSVLIAKCRILKRLRDEAGGLLD